MNEAAMRSALAFAEGYEPEEAPRRRFLSLFVALVLFVTLFLLITRATPALADPGRNEAESEHEHGPDDAPGGSGNDPGHDKDGKDNNGTNTGNADGGNNGLGRGGHGTQPDPEPVAEPVPGGGNEVDNDDPTQGSDIPPAGGSDPSPNDGGNERGPEQHPGGIEGGNEAGDDGDKGTPDGGNEAGNEGGNPPDGPDADNDGGNGGGNDGADADNDKEGPDRAGAGGDLLVNEISDGAGGLAPFSLGVESGDGDPQDGADGNVGGADVLPIGPLHGSGVGSATTFPIGSGGWLGAAAAIGWGLLLGKRRRHEDEEDATDHSA